MGFLGSAYAALNQPRKLTLKAVIVFSSIFTFTDAILPMFFGNTSTTQLDVFGHIGYSIRMMVLMMTRIILSFGLSFLNVYVLEVFPTSVRHYSLSLLVFITEFIFIFYQPYTHLFESIGLNRSIGTCIALLIG